MATQSVSSLKEALPNEGVKTLLQAFRTKVLLTTSDPDTARYASELCGKADRTRISYTVSESSSNANVGWLSGRTSSSKGSVSASKQYQRHKEPLFEEKVFFELKERPGHRRGLQWRESIAADLLLSQARLPAHEYDVVRAGAHRLRSRKDTRVSFEIILPFLKPIEHLLMSETVSEIMVNSDSSVWMEENGLKQLLPDVLMCGLRKGH